MARQASCGNSESPLLPRKVYVFNLREQKTVPTGHLIVYKEPACGAASLKSAQAWRVELKSAAMIMHFEPNSESKTVPPQSSRPSSSVSKESVRGCELRPQMEEELDSHGEWA